jgi:CheY-like chemotaxis protein
MVRRASARDEPPGGAAAPRLLLVDDNRDVLVTGGHMLAACGFEVDIARNAADAIAKVIAHPPDVIVVDVMMPGADGEAVCSALAALEFTIPIIVYTGVTSVALLAPFVGFGVRLFAIKPCVPTVVGAEAQQLLESPSDYPAVRIVTGYGETLDELADQLLAATDP